MLQSELFNNELQCHKKQSFLPHNEPSSLNYSFLTLIFLCLFYEVYRTSILEIGYVNNFDHREAWCITSSHPCFTNCISIVFAAKSGDDSNYDQGDLCFIILSRMLHHKTLLPSSSQVHLKRQQLLLLFPIKKYRYYKRLELYT